MGRLSYNDLEYNPYLYKYPSYSNDYPQCFYIIEYTSSHYENGNGGYQDTSNSMTSGYYTPPKTYYYIFNESAGIFEKYIKNNNNEYELYVEEEQE